MITMMFRKCLPMSTFNLAAILTKRRKFVITSLFLSLGFIMMNFLESEYRFWAIGILTGLTVILFFWSLAEGLGRDATLLTLILPAFFTLGVGVFWFLLPATVFARIPVIILFGLGIYALILTLNIYTVSAIRTIALVRAAKSVGFILTLFVSFLLLNAIFSLKAEVWIFVGLVILTSFLLFLQGLWVSKLERKISLTLIRYTAFFTLVIGEVAVALFFWPVTVVVGSLFLTVVMYVLLGLGQASLEGRLFSQTIRDYLMVAAVVFLVVILVTNWAG